MIAQINSNCLTKYVFTLRVTQSASPARRDRNDSTKNLQTIPNYDVSCPHFSLKQPRHKPSKNGSSCAPRDGYKEDAREKSHEPGKFSAPRASHCLFVALIRFFFLLLFTLRKSHAARRKPLDFAPAGFGDRISRAAPKKTSCGASVFASHCVTSLVRLIRSRAHPTGMTAPALLHCIIGLVMLFGECGVRMCLFW